MRYIRLFVLVGLTLVLHSAAGYADEAVGPRATLTVQADQPGVPISPMLYGIFFEEINCAGDGGLYAELLRNRSFEDGGGLEHWSLYALGNGRGELALEAGRTVKRADGEEHVRKALRLTVADVREESGGVGLINEGYWGIPLTAGASYDLTFCARASEGFGGSLFVLLEGANGTDLARTTADGLTAEWKTFTVPLTSSATDPKARLVVGSKTPGVVWFDMISLFPKETWKGHGLRPDLANMLADLKPSFVRFPGGCWVEGDTLAFAMRWKKTLGAPAERRTQYNLWQYYSTNGLGFHEYFQMCEDLGAEPLFVINCGMSHKENVPMDQMGPWVQDALDAIEYANGPVDSTWGAWRAKNGHPAPFNLKYIEVGNENGGAAYQERYPLFYDAIKARYPEIRIIADVPTEQRPADIIDEHYYSTPEFFIEKATKYDSYDRKGPRIYVGEYAVTQGCGEGNLRGALGEAAFMMGMERNSDVVVMSSYAPLFANIHYKKWNPDLINFDAIRAYGTPSYYVQKMFSENRADVVLPVAVEAPAIVQKADAPRGAIGVGTWNTHAEFKDILVTQGDKTLFKSDFTNGAEAWKTTRGNWAVADGAFQQRDIAPDCRAVAGDTAWTDYVYTLKARRLGGEEGFLVMFHVRDDADWYWWSVGGWKNVRHAVERCVNGAKSIISDEVPGRIEMGRWYDIRIEVQGPEIRCYLDGLLVHKVTPSVLKSMHAAAGHAKGAGEIVLKVANVSGEDQDTQINLNGSGSVEPVAAVTTLTSTQADDENSIENPAKVVPTTRAIDNASSQFRYTFPANSLTVLRLKGNPARPPAAP